MKILITNDDGINSKGLYALVEALSKYDHELFIMAPELEKSAVSSGLTLRDPLKLEKKPDLIKGVPTYSLTGTPADCVKFVVITEMFDFDLVVSGLNNGYNMGEDILYSGTVAAIKEASLYGKKGIAFSAERGAIDALERGFSFVFNSLLSSNIYNSCDMFNVNLPKYPTGMVITRKGTCPFDSYYKHKGNNIYVAGGEMIWKKQDESFDVGAIMNNKISVTPITLEQTDMKVFEEFKNLKF
jgi:5'-nucleotidase